MFGTADLSILQPKMCPTPLKIENKTEAGSCMPRNLTNGHYKSIKKMNTLIFTTLQHETLSKYYYGGARTWGSGESTRLAPTNVPQV